MKAIFISALFLIGTTVFAADPAKQTMDTKKMEMMKKFKAYTTPGAEHKVLANMAGNWTYTSQWWQSKDATPENTKGTSKMKMIMGGRFLQHDVKGKAMGMPFDGMGLTGYNNASKKYETTWLASTGTGTMHGEGTFDTATNTLVDTGSFVCPMDDKVHAYRGEWKITDKNNMTYAMFGPGIDDPTEYKQMEMTFKRVK